MERSNIVVGDADVLIAQLVEDDANYEKVFQLEKKLQFLNVTPIFPITAIAEALTVLKIRKRNTLAVQTLVKVAKDGGMIVEEITTSLFQNACTLFKSDDSKRNTFFDAIVVAVAKKHKAIAVFSFDSWYKKQGFKLAEEL